MVYALVMGYVLADAGAAVERLSSIRTLVAVAVAGFDRKRAPANLIEGDPPEANRLSGGGGADSAADGFGGRRLPTSSTMQPTRVIETAGQGSGKKIECSSITS